MGPFYLSHVVMFAVLNGISRQIECFIKHLFVLHVDWNLVHAVGSLGLLKISIDRNTIVVFFIRVSTYQLPNVLVYLRRACWHVLIA